MTHQAPTRPEDRIDALDIIRGFVLFGVLIVNVWADLAGPKVPNPIRLDGILDGLMLGFLNYKSLCTFSLLFGLGLAMQADKVRADGSSFASFLLRRQGALLFIGALHVLLFWNGDVLMSYAVLGLILLPLMRVSSKVLVATSLLLYAFYHLMMCGIVTRPHILTIGAFAEVLLASQTMTSAYAHGSWMQVAALRLHEWVVTYGTYLPWVLSMMAFFIAGVVLWRSGVFQSPATHRKAIRRIAIATFCPGAAISLAIALAPRPVIMRFLPLVQHSFGVSIPLLVAGYVFGILHLTQQPFWRKAFGFLAPIGRMALTNYLMQSVVATTVFCGWGFGRWGLWHTWQMAIYAVVLFAFQAAFSRWWLGRYRFGPIEWLWRSMTYGRLRPMKNQVIPVDSPSGVIMEAD